MIMEHVISPEENGRSIKDMLRNEMNISYSAMKSAKWENRIQINGVAMPVNALVHTGDVLAFIPEENHPVYSLKPYNLPLEIAYEDDYLLVVDKPAPLASQSSLNHPDDSLENAVFSYFHCAADFIYRPVNRLDKGTSGLMVISKDGTCQYAMQKKLHTTDFLREYTAVVEGMPFPLQGTISAPIDKEPSNSVKRIICENGKPSVTHYTVEISSKGRSLVHLRLETGRTHQIRVHMASMGCPVCGDFLYGTELPQLPGRFALHSAYLRFTHPVTGEAIELHSPLPEVFHRLME